MNDKKQIRAWTFYDWANSVYSLVITSAIFPIYYSQVIGDTVCVFGKVFKRGDIAAYSISFSFLIIAFLSPLLSGIADSRGNKKNFLRFFCYLGSLGCLGLFFFNKDTGIYYGLGMSILASIGFCGSLVFYNAYLPEIASKDKQDSVSARGFAMGYIGSVILLLICLVFVMKYQPSLEPMRWSFVAVGLWWFGFAQITFRGLPPVVKSKVAINIWDGFRELNKVWKQLLFQPRLKRFLLSFFFYNMGVQTVMYMATYFGTDTLKLKSEQLIVTILIIQLVAILGAWLFAKVSKVLGNIKALLILIFIWIGICLGAYLVQSATEFYVLATVVGFVMGGIQSLSRSTYSKMLPETKDTASYFSFYDVCEKIGIVIGTLTFGMVSQLLGGMRQSTLALMIYFIIGCLILLTLIKKEKTSTNQ